MVKVYWFGLKIFENQSICVWGVYGVGKGRSVGWYWVCRGGCVGVVFVGVGGVCLCEIIGFFTFFFKVLWHFKVIIFFVIAVFKSIYTLNVGLTDQCWVHKQKVLGSSPVTVLCPWVRHLTIITPLSPGVYMGTGNAGKVIGSWWIRCSEPHTTGKWVWPNSFRDGDGHPDVCSQIESLPYFYHFLQKKNPDRPTNRPYLKDPSVLYGIRFCCLFVFFRPHS